MAQSDILPHWTARATSETVESTSPDASDGSLTADRIRAAAGAALKAGRLEEAAELCVLVEAHFASDSLFLMTFGEALRRQGKRLDALGRFRRAVELDPTSSSAHVLLATNLCELGALDPALECTRKAIALNPDAPRAHYTEALVLIEALRLSEAAESLRRLLDLAPGHQQGLSTLLYLLNLIPGLDPRDVAEEHCTRAERCYPAAPRSGRAPVHGNAQLRIGFLSADLRDHPVGRFVAPLFDHLDRDRFSIHAYSTAESDDIQGEQLQRSVSHWFDARNCSDLELEARLRGDRLDVLIDLSGHTHGQRLAVLARRPAARQATWLGYANTTGMSAIDFRIVDEVLMPSGQAPTPGETLIRMAGTFACFRPEVTAPSPVMHPTGPVVFGSFHRLEKLNAKVVELWAELLRSLPEARLVLARDQLDPRRQRQLQQQFAAAGVDPARLDMRRLAPDAASHLHLFNEIDVLLDVFPWSGHTLACESLWMGVPVITLRGESMAGRLTSSALQAGGCGEWIAACPRDYRALAESLSMDLGSMRRGRADLRARIARSRLTDEVAFATAFGSAIEAIMDFKGD